MKESTQVTLNKEALMVMESLNTMMAHFMRESGKTVSCKAKENYIKLKILLFSRVASWKVKKMEQEY